MALQIIAETNRLLSVSLSTPRTHLRSISPSHLPRPCTRNAPNTQVKNKMIVHMDARSKEMIALKRENANLRARVKHLEGEIRGGAGAGPGEFRRVSTSGPVKSREGQLQPSRVDRVGSSSSSNESRKTTRSSGSVARSAA